MPRLTRRAAARVRYPGIPSVPHDVCGVVEIESTRGPVPAPQRDERLAVRGVWGGL